MVLLDTNHLEAIAWNTAEGRKLIARLEAEAVEAAASVISLEETMRGWLAEIRRQVQPLKQIPAYGRLVEASEFYAGWMILPWDEDSARVFSDMRGRGVRTPTMDLKIASIAIAHDALLLTRNTRDFESIPGLKLENWLD